ncbi:MAG: hypothetical protein Q9179_005003 [Wetmoreana sp. 5 TL-2023]
MKPALFSTLTTLLLLHLHQTSAQSPAQPVSLSNLPSCAQQCPNLLQGQTACTAPPNPAPGGTYGLQCFCGFAPLLTLTADAPVNICATCSTADNAAIQSWYKGTCNGGGGGGAGAANGQTTSSASTQSPTSTTNAAPKASSSTATAKGNSANASNVAQKDWIATHYRWVVMLIILVLGFSGLAIGGVYLKRYIHRRREARQFGVSGSRQDLETWGPGQSVHDFGAGGVENVGPIGEKGKEKEIVQAPEEVKSDRSNSRRLKKGWLPRKG